MSPKNTNNTRSGNIKGEMWFQLDGAPPCLNVLMHFLGK